MDYKKELLLFLYENNSGLVEIYPVSENTAVTIVEIKQTIIALKKDGLIDTDESFRQIGGGDPQKLNTAKSLRVKARITPSGEQYVRDTYIKKNDALQINAQQFVFASGDISAPISLANDHSDSSASQSNTTKKQKRETAIQIIKLIAIIIGAISSAIVIYQFFIK